MDSRLFLLIFRCDWYFSLIMGAAIELLLADWSIIMPKVVETQSMLLQLILVFVIFLGFVKNGNAGITSAFIRSEWPSIDIPLDNEVFAVPKGYNAPQQVSNWNILCLKDLWRDYIWAYGSTWLSCLFCPTLMLMELSCNYVKMERKRNDVSVHVHILIVFLTPSIWTPFTQQVD
jgi:hypothetical protein